MVIAAASSTAMVGSSRLRIFNAAMDHAVQAITLDHSGSRTSRETRLMTTHTLSSVAANSSRYCGHCIVPAVSVASHCADSHTSGSSTARTALTGRVQPGRTRSCSSRGDNRLATTTDTPSSSNVISSCTALLATNTLSNTQAQARSPSTTSCCALKISFISEYLPMTWARRPPIRAVFPQETVARTGPAQ